MVFDKMAAICSDFKWLSFRISDPIQNPDHFQPNLFLTIQNLDKSVFQIPTVHNFVSIVMVMESPEQGRDCDGQSHSQVNALYDPQNLGKNLFFPGPQNNDTSI